MFYITTLYICDLNFIIICNVTPVLCGAHPSGCWSHSSFHSVHSKLWSANDPLLNLRLFQQNSVVCDWKVFLWLLGRYQVSIADNEAKHFCPWL